MPIAPRWKPIFSASCDALILANGVSWQVCVEILVILKSGKYGNELGSMQLQVVIGLSMVVVGLALATYVIVLIVRERKRDRNIID